MTKPIVPKPKIGRPALLPPADATERVRALSAEGHSTVGIAQQLGVGRKTFDKWRADIPEIEEAYRAGVERERYDLHSGLAEKARAGNIVAAMFLLKSKHGYKEGDQGDQGGRVNISINLPGAMTLAQFNALGTVPDRRRKPMPSSEYEMVPTGTKADGSAVMVRRQTGPAIYTGGVNADGRPTTARISQRVRSLAL